MTSKIRNKQALAEAGGRIYPSVGEPGAWQPCTFPFGMRGDAGEEGTQPSDLTARRGIPSNAPAWSISPRDGAGWEPGHEPTRLPKRSLTSPAQAKSRRGGRGSGPSMAGVLLAHRGREAQCRTPGVPRAGVHGARRSCGRERRAAAGRRRLEV